MENAQSIQSILKEKLFNILQADSIAVKHNNAKEHLKNLMLVAMIYVNMDSMEIAKKYLHTAIDLGKRIPEPDSVGNCLNSLGILFYYQSEYDSALKYYNESASIFRKTNNRSYLAQTLTNVGIIYFSQGNYDSALKINTDVAIIFDSLNDRVDQASAYTTMGNIYKDMHRLDDALEYHQKAFQIFIEKNDSENMAACQDNIGNVFRYKKEYDKAMSNYESALRINKKYGHAKSIATTIDNIAMVYLENKNYRKAETNFRQTLNLRFSSDDKDGFITASNRIAQLFLEEGDIKAAEKFAVDALNISPRKRMLKPRIENHLLLARIYQKAGQASKALQHAFRAMELKDSLFDADLPEKIAAMKIKYETELKDKENIILQSNFIRQKNKALTWIIVGYSASSIIIAGFASFILWRKRTQKKIALIQRQLFISQIKTHFVENTLMSINRYINLNEIEKASHYLIMLARLIGDVLRNSSSKYISLKRDLAILEDYIQLQKLQFIGPLTYTITVDDNIDKDCTLIPPLIFQVLVENSLTHGLEKEVGGVITISISSDKTDIIAMVEDNGLGRRKDGDRNLQIHDKAEEPHGSELVEKLIKNSREFGKRTWYRVADLNDENDNSLGTRVEFTLPYVLKI